MLEIEKKKNQKREGDEEEEKNRLQTLPLSPFSSSSSSSERLFRGVDVVNIFVSCGKLFFLDRLVLIERRSHFTTSENHRRAFSSQEKRKKAELSSLLFPSLFLVCGTPSLDR